MTPSERWPALLLHLDTDDWQRAIDLAQALGVSERTVYRDVHDLMEAGVPLQGVPGKGYRLPESYLLEPVTLTVDEAVMLVLGSAYAAQNFDGRYRASARAAQRKLLQSMPEEARERAFSLQGSVQLVPPSVFGNPAEEVLLRRLRRALLEERAVRLRMGNGSSDGDSSPSSRSMLFHPYGLVRQNATWRIVGVPAPDSRATSREDAPRSSGPAQLDALSDPSSPRAADSTGSEADGEADTNATDDSPDRSSRKRSSRARRVTSIRLDEVTALELTSRSFDRPSGYRSTSGAADVPPDRTLRVVFDAEAAPLVQVGTSMHVVDNELLSNGRRVMTLKVFHELEVMPWLLSWGRHVEVLAPAALRRRIAREARYAAAQYTDAPTLLDDE